MNKTDNKVELFQGTQADDKKSCRKSIKRIVEELRSSGIHAEVCQRVCR